MQKCPAKVVIFRSKIFYTLCILNNFTKIVHNAGFMIWLPWVICGLYILCHFGKHCAMLRFVLNIWYMVVPFMPTNAPLAGCCCKDAALLFGGQRALLCVYIFMWWPFQDVNTVMAMCGGGTSGRGLFYSLERWRVLHDRAHTCFRMTLPFSSYYWTSFGLALLL